MQRVDEFAERLTRRLAGGVSRRSLFALIGGAITGAAVFPVLPVARADSGGEQGRTGVLSQDPGDKTSCDYWRYCAMDGYLCGCCGGSISSCPPGTEMSAITWIGTCRNPADNRNYVISYNDCCGKPACKRCFCSGDEGARPIARPQLNNEIVWCLGGTQQSYTCSTAVIVGVAAEQG
jgi:methylamine dehydrogenase light chain